MYNKEILVPAINMQVSDMFTRDVKLNVSHIICMATGQNPKEIIMSNFHEGPTEDMLLAGLNCDGYYDMAVAYYAQSVLFRNDMLLTTQVIVMSRVPLIIQELIGKIDKSEPIKRLIAENKLDEAAKALSLVQDDPHIPIRLWDDNDILCQSSISEMVKRILHQTGNNHAIALAHLLRVLAILNLFEVEDCRELYTTVCGDDNLLSDLESYVKCDLPYVFSLVSATCPDWGVVKSVVQNKDITCTADEVFEVLRNLSPTALKNCENGSEVETLIKSHLK